MKKLLLLTSLLFLTFACSLDTGEAEFTGNEMLFQMIPGSANGQETTGTLLIRERTAGVAQIEIRLYGVVPNSNHPAHLHYGSLEDDGNIATMLNPVIEIDGVGQSVTILNELENGDEINFTDLISFDGSVKIHFEASGPRKDEILGSVNIGINSGQNQAYLSGERSITVCNSEF